MFEAQNISLRYGKHLALSEVSVSLTAGDCVVILGANGAGKSSLLRALTRMAPMEPGGTLRFRGQDMTRVPPAAFVEAGIAHVPEGRGVFTDMSVADNLWLGTNPKRARQGAAAQQAEVLSIFPRLSERMGQRVGTMSGGEQQMVAIARALMSKPDLLLLDEPSLGLAPIMVGELFTALRRIRDSGVTMLIVEQNVKASLGIANRGYVLESSRITHEDSAANLLRSPAVQKAFLGG